MYLPCADNPRLLCKSCGKRHVSTQARVACITHPSDAAAASPSACSMRAWSAWQSHALLQNTARCLCLWPVTHQCCAIDSSCLRVQEASEAGVLAARWRLKASEATKQVSRALLPCASWCKSKDACLQAPATPRTLWSSTAISATLCDEQACRRAIA